MEFGQVSLADSRNPSDPLVSVVICTKGRPAVLARCIDSVLSTSYDSYEIVVVDNSASPQDESAAYSSGLTRYVWEGKPGLGFARAAGIHSARGEIVAMTDDDCVVDRGWLHALVAGFREEDVLCCTGQVAAFEARTPAQIVLETFCNYSKGQAPKLFGGPADARMYLMPQEVGTGANMAFRRRAFDLVGSFDGALGTGTPAFGGEDLDVFSRILRIGGRILYQPGAVVYHEHPRDYDQLRRNFFRNGIGYNAFMTKLALTVRKPEAFKAAIDRTRFWYGWTKQSLKYRLLGRPHMPIDLQLAYLFGSLFGPIGYLRSARKARRLLAASSLATRNLEIGEESLR